MSKRKSLKGRIEKAAAAVAAKASAFRTYKMVKTDRICYGLPWNCGDPKPWRDGYTRVLIPVPNPLPGQTRAVTQIVRNDHLSPLK